MYRIRIAGSDVAFSVDDHETILDAALRHDLLLPHDCRCGGCGGCKGRVLSGEVDHGYALDTTLSPEDRAQGYALFCCAQPRSDLVIEPGYCEGLAEMPVRRLALRVLEVRRLSDERALIQLETPPAKRLRHRPGQQVDVLFSDGTRRRFAITSTPEDDKVLAFEVSQDAGDRYAGYLRDDIQRGETLRIEGPYDPLATSRAA